MLCEICGRREAEHRCRLCRRWVCDRCYNVLEGLCTDCLRLRWQATVKPVTTPLLVKLLPLLFIIPMILIFAGFTLVFLGLATGEGASYGGFIIIGPFPIVFGKNVNPTVLTVGGTILTVVAILLTLLPLILRRTL